MASRQGAGSLDKRIEFQRLVETQTPQGGTTTGWEPVFTQSARLMPKLGGEAVTAGRLQAVQPYLLTTRSSAQARAVTPAWRAVNSRSGVVYNIKSIVNIDERGAYLEMLVAEGEVAL